MYITLNEAKHHLNLDEIFNEDDNYILDLIKVCEDAVEKRMGRRLDTCLDESTGELYPSVKHTILLLISTYYNQREATSNITISKVPLTFDFLADLNKKYYI